MTITLYNYDAITGERLNDYVAELSPLDNEPIVMSFSTSKVPPTVSTNQRAVYRDVDDNVPLLAVNGKWKTVPDYRGQSYWDADGNETVITEIGVAPPDGSLSTKPDDSLEVLKNQKWKEIKDQRSSHEFGTFFWNGHAFDADQQSQQRITLAILGAQMDSSLNIDWRLANNELITLSSAEMIQVGLALGQNTENAFAHANALRTLIESAQTKEELEDIVW